MNSSRETLKSAVRSNSWSAFGPRAEQKVVCTVGTVSALASSMYMGYSLGSDTKYPVLGTVMSVGASVAVGFLAGFVAHIPAFAISSIPLFVAVGAGRTIRNFHEDKYTIHIGK
jgi:hypothetical protein